MKNSRSFFQNAQKAWQDKAEAAEKYSARLSFLRVIFFLGAIAMLFFFYRWEWWGLLLTAALVLPWSFGMLVVLHNTGNKRKKMAQLKLRLNEDELKRLDLEIDQFETGESFNNYAHPYTQDLDIFGLRSIFQWLSRCVSPNGKKVLAHWLSKPGLREEILERQNRVRALAEITDWRQDCMATIAYHHSEELEAFGILENWLKNKNQKRRTLHTLVPILLTLITLGLLVLASLGLILWAWFLGMVLINFLVVTQANKRLKKEEIKVVDRYAGLKGLSEVLEKLGHEDFKSRLDDYRISIQGEGNYKKVTGKILRLMDWTKARGNMFYGILNMLFFLDIHIDAALESWKTNHSERVLRWLHGIAILEAEISLADQTFAMTPATFPEILETGPILEVKGIIHPLLQGANAISNTFSIENEGSLALITGANMSGKSTFLRTLGVNMVLAYAGAPVIAQSMRISLMQIFTCMRTNDNLSEGASGFYAELFRIKSMLNTLETSPIHVFFMLDEVLKGTNSDDRHKGALALMHQLSKSRGLGLVTTHDLPLGQTCEKEKIAKNYSFNSSVEGEKINFTFKLEPGICNSFNASFLMKMMGIKI